MSSLCESLATNVKCSFTSASAESNDFSDHSLKTYSRCLVNAMCNLLLFVNLPNCTSLSDFVLVCVCSTACACGNRNMLNHNQPTRSLIVQWNPGTYALNADTHFERAEEKSDAPANVAVCALFAHTRENATEQKHKENVQKPQKSGPCGSRRLTVVSVVEGFGRELHTENRPLYGEIMQTLIPLALRKTILGAFRTLPRKHNNFGVSSFIYLLCFSSNEAQETETCTVVFGL